MKRFAFVNKINKIAYVLTPAVPMYEHGVPYGEFTAVDVTDTGLTDQDLIINYGWDGLSLVKIPPSPGECFDWDGIAWVFNLTAGLKQLRLQRDEELRLCDWTQMPDAPLDEAKKLEWQQYRQALRNLPDSYLNMSSLKDVVWPTKPQQEILMEAVIAGVVVVVVLAALIIKNKKSEPADGKGASTKKLNEGAPKSKS